MRKSDPTFRLHELDRKPEPPAREAELYLQAFFATREEGFSGLLPLKVSELAGWMNEYEIFDRRLRRALIYVCSKLNTLEREHSAAKSRKSAEATKAGASGKR